MDDYNGLYKTNPRLAFAMMLAMFSLAGIPPSLASSASSSFLPAHCSRGTVAIYVLVLIALINTIVSLYYYLLVVKEMFINQGPCPVEHFRSSCSERLGLWITVGGVVLLGIVSCCYNYLLDIASNSPMNMYFIQ